MYFWIATGLFLALMVFLIIRDLKKPDTYCEDCVYLHNDGSSIEFAKCKLRPKREYVARDLESYDFCGTWRSSRKCKWFKPKETE